MRLASSLSQNQPTNFAEEPKRYESFVADTLNDHSATRLSCGGRRSSRALDPSIAEDAIFDDRILGGGHFVEQVLHGSRPDQNIPQMSLSELVERVATCLQIAPGTLNAPSKERHIVRAKAIICHLAVRKLGIKGLDVAAILGYSSTAVTQAAKRGETLLLAERELGEILREL